MSRVIKYFLLLVIISCGSKNSDAELIESQSFNREDYFNYKSSYGDYQFIVSYNSATNRREFDTFTPEFYTNVRPMKDKKDFPEQIFSPFNQFENSRKYFYNHLKGKFVVYIEKNKNIIYREFFHSYSGKKYDKKDINMPRNLQDLTEYFKSKNVNSKIIDTIDIYNTEAANNLNERQKADLRKTNKSKTYDILVEKKFYRITLDSSFSSSCLFYDVKDTLNAGVFNSQIGHAF